LGGLPVLDVVEVGRAIVHRVEGVPAFAPGDTVAMAVDGTRRRDHSQQHSGQHLLSAILERNYGVHTIGFHLGTTYSTIDVSCAAMNEKMIGEIEKAAEDFIAKDHPYTIHVCPPEDPNSFPLRKKLPIGEDIIRIVEIGGYDWVACCGTHVSSAGELRMFKILSTEKYKGNTRIFFAAGGRAVALMAARYGLLAEIAAGLGTSAEEVPARVSALSARSVTLEAERDALLRERAGLEIDLALGGPAVGSSPAPSAPGTLSPAPDAGLRTPLVFSYSDRGADAAFETAKAGAACGVAVVAISIPDRTVCVTAPAAARATAAAPKPPAATSAAPAQSAAGTPKPLVLGPVLTPLLQQFGGRGGGGANSFRAVFESADKAKAFASAAASLLS
jgi:Ser-tRNA(Ala) deacylase AlaX